MLSSFVPTENTQSVIRPERIFITIICLPRLVVFLLFLAASVYFKLALLIVVGIPFLLFGMYKYLFMLSHTFYLTDQQLIIQRGLFTRTINYLELYRVKDIAVEQKLWMRLFSLMSIRLISFDAAEPLLVINGIKTSSLPHKIRSYVQESRKNNKVLSVDSNSYTN